MQQQDVSESQVYVSLHEKNGIHVGGLPIDKYVIDIPNIEVQNINPNVKQIIHYLSNLEYIRINIYGEIQRQYFCCPCVFYCDLHQYSIDVLNKCFSYGKFPNEQEMDFIVSKLETQIKRGIIE